MSKSLYWKTIIYDKNLLKKTVITQSKIKNQRFTIASKSINKEIPDVSNTKEYCISFLKKKNQKSFKPTKSITQDSKF